jgi:glycerol-3-phosphate dehydrogenase (NAD(P)+)
MKKILILGAGAMGSAFTVPCVENNHDVVLSGTHLEDNTIDQIIQNNYLHPALNCKLPKNLKIIKFDNFSKEFKNKPDLIVIAVSSKGIDWAAKEILKYYSKDISILLLTKGLTIIDNKFSTLSDKISLIFEKKGFSNLSISAIKGPCLATGLINKIRTSAVVANKDISKSQWIGKLISTNYYTLEFSEDIIGVEICGAIKNIYSMIIGASKGLSSETADDEIKSKYHYNTAASLIHRSISEMVFFTKFFKGKEETVYGLAGIGDLYVSAIGGRNSKMGKYLGDGYNYLEAKKKFMINDTVEGAELAFEIGSKIMKEFSKNDLPLMINLLDSIINNKKFKINW